MHIECKKCHATNHTQQGLNDNNPASMAYKSVCQLRRPNQGGAYYRYALNSIQRSIDINLITKTQVFQHAVEFIEAGILNGELAFALGRVLYADRRANGIRDPLF